MDNLPKRHRLPHIPPPSVAPYTIGAPFFITFCVDRVHYGIPMSKSGCLGPLTDAPIANAILASIDYRREKGIMHPHVATVMPDHVHIIASFSAEVTMRGIVAALKHYIAFQHGVVWQDGFFDHRIRNDSEHDDKWRYILGNPVDKGLCSSSELWPWLRIWPKPW